jgi:hypothetical protein
VLDRTCPSDEVVNATKMDCDVELPIRVEVNVLWLVSLSLGMEDVDDGTEVAEDGVVLVKVELTLAGVVGVVEISVVGGLVVVVALTVVVVDSVSVVGA